MREYMFNEIEKNLQKTWDEKKIFETKNKVEGKENYYVLEMLPFPSGKLHMGHVRNYTIGDVLARYKSLQGYNVLHPMGYDAFGLPAEQYAIQTGQHPAITTDNNIKRYREQLDKIGFSYDWDREFSTTDENYYGWTQWIFLKFYNSYFDEAEQKAKPIAHMDWSST